MIGIPMVRYGAVAALVAALLGGMGVQPVFACSSCYTCSSGGGTAHGNDWYSATVFGGLHGCTSSIEYCPHALCLIKTNHQFSPEYLASLAAASPTEIFRFMAAAPEWVTINLGRMALQISAPCSPEEILAHIPIDPVMVPGIVTLVNANGGRKAGDTVDEMLLSASGRPDPSFYDAVAMVAAL